MSMRPAGRDGDVLAALYLDLAHQLEVLELLAELNERDARAIVMVLHDLNAACRYAD